MRNPLDRRLWRQYSRLCGIDEAGRGPLAGPVVAAAVILPRFCLPPGIADSKQLSPLQRAQLFEWITYEAEDWSVGVVNHRDIDRLNIRNASFQAMHKALARLTVKPDYILVDGYEIPGLKLPQQGIIRGDCRSVSIAAASIIAKVVRDRIMTQFHRCYPDYGFNRHKGYGTKQHLIALQQLGPCPIHRTTFAPVGTALRANQPLTNSGIRL